MIDSFIKPKIDPVFDRVGRFFATKGYTPNFFTLSGFAIGVLAIVSVSQQYFMVGLALFWLNRLFDSFDGAVARSSQLTDFGGFLDIVCDFIIYSGLVFGFSLATPEHALWGLFLIFSFIGPMASFLAYAIFAAKTGRTTSKRGRKSLYYAGGLCEGTETFVALSLMFLVPAYFPLICLVFGLMCWVTTIGRFHAAYVDFG